MDRLSPKAWAGLIGVVVLAGVGLALLRPRGTPAPKVPAAAESTPSKAAPSVPVTPAGTIQAPVVVPPLPPALAGPAFEDFVGAEACGECHATQYALWRQSTHGKAGGAPADLPAVSQFDGTVLTFANAAVRLEVNAAGKHFYHVDAEGKPRQTLEVAAFVGGGHMLGGGTQTAFTRFPDNSLRLIPFDYSKTDDVWFCEGTGDRGWMPITADMALDDCVFWPPKSNFGAICGNCHASQTLEGYDAARRRETTRSVDYRINCESCHGPGRKHVEQARRPDAATLDDLGIESLTLLTPDESLDVCFRCHAVTQPLAAGYLPGGDFAAHYGLNFYPKNKHFADGRVNGFGYQEGHRWSDCYLNGSMTCVDCHAPHSGGYRDVDGLAIPGKLDDQQCLGCHASKINAGLGGLTAHTHHPADSAGSRCTACHMPFLQQTDLGERVRYARSDHVISIPRPDHDAATGVMTACAAAGCHADEPKPWAQAAVTRLWGELKPPPAIVTDLKTLQSSDDQAALTRAFLAERPGHPAAEFERLRAGLARLEYMSEAVIARIEQLAKHPDLDVRALALSYLHEAEEHLPRLRPVLTAALADLGEDALGVRRRWSLWLALRSDQYSGRGRLAQAITALEKAMLIDPESKEASRRLASAYGSAGRANDALREHLNTLRLGPRTVEEHDRTIHGLCTIRASMGQGSATGPETQAADALCAGEPK